MYSSAKVSILLYENLSIYLYQKMTVQSYSLHLDAVPDVRVVVVSSFPLMIYKTSGMTLFGPISIRYTMTPSSYQSTINLKQRMYGFKCR